MQCMHILIRVDSFIDAIDAKFNLLTSSLTSRAVTVPGMAKSSPAQRGFMDICRLQLIQSFRWLSLKLTVLVICLF